jgi:hypothetical protein
LTFTRCLLPQLEEDFVKANPDWVKELQIMVTTKVKAEIQARRHCCACTRHWWWTEVSGNDVYVALPPQSSRRLTTASAIATGSIVIWFPIPQSGYMQHNYAMSFPTILIISVSTPAS